MQTQMDRYILGMVESPVAAEMDGRTSVSLTRLEDVRGILGKRSRDTHKGSYGRVGVLSGSRGMAGAAVLCCNAALRSGAGLVKACIPEAIYAVVEAMSLETITCPYDEADISYEKLKRELVDFSDIISTGSGCANLDKYDKLLEFLLENSEKPLILDAEGINKLELERLRGHKKEIILTPHYGEMARLLKVNTEYFREAVAEKAAEFAEDYGVYLVLKGARTVIACPDGSCYINTTGNPGMATAGSGDVLTGVIAALAARDIEIVNALKAAVFLHGLAGDIGSGIVGEDSLIAGDLIRYMPEAIKRLKV